MKKPIIVISFFIIPFISGCNPNEHLTKGLVEDYYNAVIHQNYEKAFEVSRIYDLGSRNTVETNFTEKEAKEFFKKKLNYLKKVDYKVKSYEIVEIQQHDGHTFIYDVSLEIQVNGETMNRREKVWPKVDHENIAITQSEDPLAKYRDGRVNFEIEEHWLKDIKKESNNTLNSSDSSI